MTASTTRPTASTTRPTSARPHGRRAAGGPGARPVRILAVADSDSYLKWGATTLAALAEVGELDLVLLRSPILPSPDQQRAALAGTPFADVVVPVLTPLGLRARLRTTDPDVVLLASTGPVAELVVRLVARVSRHRGQGRSGHGPRPALVGGLPGMSYPATLRALRFRAGQDVFVVHSRRERREFAAVADLLGLDLRVALAPLPFLRTTPTPTCRDAASPKAPPLARVVFAPQARVPATRAHRETILRALARLAAARPDVDVVLKVRGRAGEAQTHHEDLPFDTLLAGLVAAGDIPSGALRVATGPLTEHLGPGAALVTVSSTAALESLAAGVPTLVLEDFGVNERMLNAVFLGSGCLGSLDDLASGRFGVPDPAWLEDNYLQSAPSELPAVVRGLAAARRAGTLPPPSAVHRRGVVLGRARRRVVRTFVRSQAPAAVLTVLDLPGRIRRALRVMLRAGPTGRTAA